MAQIPESEDQALGRFRRWTARIIERIQISETSLLLGTAIVIGVLTGLAAVLFIQLIEAITLLGFGRMASSLPGLGRLWIIIIPTLGGLLAGPIITYFASEAKGHGVPEVMQALVLRGGRIRPRVALAKVAASSLCIGTGGSAGREGPIVQVGSTLGSALGQLLKMSDDRIRNLVACGAAAGVAATFNAPIAGVAFAIEVLIGDLGLSLLSNVVISAVAASVVSHTFLGGRAAFSIPGYHLSSPVELVFYVILGVLGALVGVAFIWVLYKAEDMTDSFQALPAWLKPAAGGLFLGLLGYLYPLLLEQLGMGAGLARSGLPLLQNIPHVFGSGFSSIEASLQSPLPWLLLASLLVLKMAGTAITLGSGNSGGVFAPSLFMGAMLGGLFGLIVHALAPETAPSVGPYAVAGMAATFAGAARAPLTSILIAFEMSNDYQIILPLMASSIVAGVVAQRIFPESIYSLKLARRGLRLRHGRDVDVLDGVLVEEVMDLKPPTVSPSMMLEDLRDYLFSSHHHGALVVDEKATLSGIVTLQDLENAMHEDSWRTAPVSSIATRDLLVVHPEEPIGTALQRFALRDIGRLPVVDRDNPTRLLGIVRRVDVTRAYQQGMLRRRQVQERAQQLRISQRDGVRYLELEVKSKSAVSGHRVRDLQLPPQVLLTTRRRGSQSQLLHGDDILKPGDFISALADPECTADLEKMFYAGPEPDRSAGASRDLRKR